MHIFPALFLCVHILVFIYQNDIIVYAVALLAFVQLPLYAFPCQQIFLCYVISCIYSYFLSFSFLFFFVIYHSVCIFTMGRGVVRKHAPWRMITPQFPPFLLPLEILGSHEQIPSVPEAIRSWTDTCSWPCGSQMPLLPHYGLAPFLQFSENYLQIM